VGVVAIERIVLKEGLPHPEINGLWIKYPNAYRPDIAWHGAHDSLVNYARQLGIKGVTLHSYRYAWAERAKVAGYPERFAQEALERFSK